MSADQSARDIQEAFARLNRFVPVEATDPRAKYVAEMLERIDLRDSTVDETELRIQMAATEATLVLAQEVSNLRQSLERLLGKETT